MGHDSWGEYARELRRRDLAPSSRARYAQVLADFHSWLGERPPTADLARDYLAGLREHGYRPRSILLYYRILKPFLASLGQEFKVRVRKPRDLPPYYDAGDIERLISQAQRGLSGHTPAIRRENTALVLLMAWAGLRRGEALALTVADVDFERRLIRVRQGKGGVDRNIPMAQRLVAPLREQCRGNGRQSRLFTVSPGRCYRRIVRLARACGLEGFHPHSLRHAFATRLVEQGANLKAVQQLLGHAGLETTAIYLDVAPDHLRDAVGLLEPTPQTTTATGYR